MWTMLLPCAVSSSFSFLFSFCITYVHKTFKMTELARPVMETIFLVYNSVIVGAYVVKLNDKLL